MKQKTFTQATCWIVRFLICATAFLLGSIVLPMKVFALTGSYWSAILVVVGPPAAWVFQPIHMQFLGRVFYELWRVIWESFLRNMHNPNLYSRNPLGHLPHQ